MAAVAINVMGICVVVSKVVLINDSVGQSIKVHISPEVGVIRIDAGIDNNRAEGLATECRETWVSKKLIKIDEGSRRLIWAKSDDSWLSSLGSRDRGQQIIARGGIIINDGDRGRTLITNHCTGGWVDKLNVEEFSGFCLIIIANSDCTWVSQQRVLHGNTMPRLVGCKCNRDRIKVVVVIHRSGCTAAAG